MVISRLIMSELDRRKQVRESLEWIRRLLWATLGFLAIGIVCYLYQYTDAAYLSGGVAVVMVLFAMKVVQGIKI
jgi:cell division protein FtsW (lipid II flippase)